MEVSAFSECFLFFIHSFSEYKSEQHSIDIKLCLEQSVYKIYDENASILFNHNQNEEDNNTLKDAFDWTKNNSHHFSDEVTVDSSNQKLLIPSFVCRIHIKRSGYNIKDQNWYFKICFNHFHFKPPKRVKLEVTIEDLDTFLRHN